MTQFTIQLDDKKAAFLREKSKQFGLAPEQLVAATIADLIALPDPNFEQAMKNVLNKNNELYIRLA